MDYIYIKNSSTSLALTASTGGVNDVIGGIARISIRILRLIKLGKIVHANTFPKGRATLSDSHAKQHDSILFRPCATASATTSLGACARVVAVVSTL